MREEVREERSALTPQAADMRLHLYLSLQSQIVHLYLSLQSQIVTRGNIPFSSSGNSHTFPDQVILARK